MGLDHSELAPILLIEDSEEDVELIQWALKKLSITLPMVTCSDGDEALDYLFRCKEQNNAQKAPLPAIILLDLKLASVDGLEVLQQIKQDDQLCTIPVIIWTSSSDEHDIEVSFKQGASSYILKPMNINQLLSIVKMLNQYWFGIAVLPKLNSDNDIRMSTSNRSIQSPDSQPMD